MTGWKEEKLENIFYIVKEVYKPSNEHQYKYVGLEHIEQGTLRLNGWGYSNSVQSNKYFFKKDDILFGKLRPYFRKVIKAPFDGVCSTDIWVCRAKKDFDQNFLFYFLANQEFIDTANSTDEGTRMPRADWNYLKKTTWIIPPLPEQKAIAEVLSSLDDKIDLLTRQNKTLEDLAQAYFRKWFIEDASDEWEVGKLGDFVEVIDNRGKTPPYQDIPTEYPIIEVKSISGDNRFIDYQKCEKFVLESTYKTWFRGYIKPLDVLVSTVGSVGEIAQVLLEHGVIAQNVIGLRSKGTSPYHLFEYMKYMKNEIKELDIGSVQPSIKVPHLLSLQYVKPDRDSLRKFDDFSKELVNKMISNFMQIQTLQKLRDTLLPKLISGEIRLKM